MFEINFKTNQFLGAWKKYSQVIRILMKKSVRETQVLNLNRSDFERDAKRKYGHKFVVEFINGKPAMIIAGREIVQSFTQALLSDEVTRELLLKHNYTFALTTKYQLEIKMTDTVLENVGAEAEEENKDPEEDLTLQVV
ncbi:MAG TPA: hypothetical protein VEV83_09775 [Parafilimonas sp.]|nr:hypothetical protein [Parafilimonas sp.]